MRQKALKRKHPVNTLFTGSEIDVNGFFNAESKKKSFDSGILHKNRNSTAKSTNSNDGASSKINGSLKVASKNKSSSKLSSNSNRLNSKKGTTSSTFDPNKSISSTNASVAFSPKQNHNFSTPTPSTSSQLPNEDQINQGNMNMLLDGILQDSYEFNPFADTITKQSQYMPQNPNNTYQLLDVHQTPETNCKLLKLLSFLQFTFLF